MLKRCTPTGRKESAPDPANHPAHTFGAALYTPSSSISRLLGTGDAAQVSGDNPLFPDGGAVLPQLLHVLLPVGAVHGRGKLAAVCLQGLHEAQGLLASEQVGLFFCVALAVEQGELITRNT